MFENINKEIRKAIREIRLEQKTWNLNTTDKVIVDIIYLLLLFAMLMLLIIVTPVALYQEMCQRYTTLRKEHANE